MLRCNEVTRLYASEEIRLASWQKRLAAFLHLMICRSCQRYVRELRSIGEAVRKAAEENPIDEEHLESLVRRAVNIHSAQQNGEVVSRVAGSAASDSMKPEQASELLQRLGAPTRLLTHVGLVAEAGEAIISELESLGVQIDKDFIRSGIVLHDVGKTVHLLELGQEGELHGETGRALLLREGIDTRLAEVCVSHSAWREAKTTEELVIACADKLWKGKRVADLEELLVRQVNDELQQEYWEVFTRLDSCFEAISLGADERLERSRLPA